MPPPYELLRESALEVVELRDVPFRYFLARHCLAPNIVQTLLEWFETDAPWQLVETDFYQQYEFRMLNVALPENVSPLTSPDNFSTLRREMAEIFDVAFDERILLVAHKLVPGQRIAIHNDYLVGKETHRLTIQINRGLRDEDGGLFMLFNSFEPSDIHRIIRPVCGSVIGFEIGENSHHAVSLLHGGERYTLVYSFYAKRNSRIV
ncbi:MAG: 2OG-Fe(II) oxygenase [Nitrospira sp.]|nr:2OG-Fe(II) oxygenase [Nitrospira sp.]MCY4132736.1 2OG-Fe(II) oxygenase [Nitrospira sp.]